MDVLVPAPRASLQERNLALRNRHAVTESWNRVLEPASGASRLNADQVASIRMSTQAFRCALVLFRHSGIIPIPDNTRHMGANGGGALEQPGEVARALLGAVDGPYRDGAPFPLPPPRPMDSTVSLPLWLFVVIALFAAWAAMERLMVPSVRWFLRQRTNRVIEEINTRLPIEIPQFNL